MGTFLAMSAVMGGKLAEVEKALKKFAASRGGKMEPTGSQQRPNMAILGEGKNGTSVVYPGEFYDWDDASKFLSVEAGKPTFSFHIHDGDLWMYVLFRDGQIFDQFNTIPDYWGELEDVVRGSWTGDAAKVAEIVPGAKTSSISKYLVAWNDDLLESDPRKKAYPDDEYFYGDDWQLVDFMRRLGLVYPIDDKGKVTGRCYTFESPSSQGP